jgi:hypothetical protein
MPQDKRPGRHVMYLDFNHFRTIGLRRSVGEGVNSRFVTGERLELALKVCFTPLLLSHITPIYLPAYSYSSIYLPIYLYINIIP